MSSTEKKKSSTPKIKCGICGSNLAMKDLSDADINKENKGKGDL